MKKFIKTHIPFLVMSLLLLLMIVFLIVLNVLKNDTQIAEQWTRTFGRNYTKVMSQINKNFPFSLTEFINIGAIFFGVIWLGWGFSLLGNGKIWPFINRVMMIVLMIVGSVTMHYASIGMAYTRAPLPIDGYTGEIKKEDFKQIATYFVQDYNYCIQTLGIDEKGEIIMPYSREDLALKVRLEFNKLNDDYFSKTVAHPKELMTSGLYTTVGIVGMYYGAFGEANYSSYCTNAELPFTMAHELCHSIGVLREDDAQFVAFYVLSTSDDPLLRYAAYHETFNSILSITTMTGVDTDYAEVGSLICSEIRANYKYIYNHWKGKMFLADLGDKINDWYLKTFSQEKGTVSYQDTKPVIDEHEQVIYLSNYQRIYFKIYYDNHN